MLQFVGLIRALGLRFELINQYESMIYFKKNWNDEHVTLTIFRCLIQLLENCKVSTIPIKASNIFATLGGERSFVIPFDKTVSAPGVKCIEP